MAYVLHEGAEGTKAPHQIFAEQELAIANGVEHSEPYRLIREGTLSDILDEEFRRCYRFESISHLFHDLKGLLRRVVAREEAQEGLDPFLAGSLGSERQ